MTLQLVVAIGFGVAGVAALATAVVHERRMQEHRRDGVSYKAATLRRDGGWRREDLFSPEGLVHQRRASRFGLAGAVLLIAGLLSWIVLGTR
jgi:hypothetical protein